MPAEPKAAEEVTTAEERPTTEERPTAAEASAWLAQTRPAAVLSLLKDVDFRAAVTPAFAGFRPELKSLSLPLVRTRLAEAAAKDKKLAEKLRSLSGTEPKVEPVPVKKAAHAAPAPAKPDPMAVLRAERETWRRERDTARQALTLAQTEQAAAIKARAQAEGERDEAQRIAKKQAERIGRLERQTAKARELEARLLKALSEDKVSPPPVSRSRSAGMEPAKPNTAGSPWPAAVRHLLDRGKFETALALAEDVLKTDADDLDALEIAVRAWEGRKDPRRALAPARRLLARQLKLPDYPAASETVLTLFRLLPTPEQAEPDVRFYLAELPAADSAAVAAAHLMLSRLRGIDPASHQWLTAYITARTSLGPTLMPPPGALGPDDPLPLSLKMGRPVTARHLADAINQNQITLVDSARAALLGLEASDPEVFARVWAALEQAASDDPARLPVLRRVPRGAAVVDGSNVAWFDQESLAQGYPRLRALLAMRRTLWGRGFFPVVLYADANLPYFVDDKPGLLAMRDRRELTFVDAGTVADEVLLRVAKQMSAPLITNDKMEDWDPEGTVQKVRYAISMSGEAYLLSEL